jgi:THO complex subunit 1
MDLITQTPPNGPEMAAAIGQILEREKYWNEWKNEGCSEIKPDEIPKNRGTGKKSSTRGAGDEILSAERVGRYSLGNKELSRLWNLCPDNWEACRSKKRVFTPTVEEYFDEIAKASRDKRLRTISGDPNFTWRGLRLLSQKSSHFFAPSTQLVRPVYAYMDSVVDSLSLVLATDNPSHSDAMDDAEDISDEEFLKLPDEGGRASNATSPARDGTTNGTMTLVSKELISQIAPKLADCWKKLAQEFTFADDEIEYWESETPNNPALAAERMLLIWIEQFPEDATIIRLQQILAKHHVDVKLPIHV